jgi:hypothetical protein
LRAAAAIVLRGAQRAGRAESARAQIPSQFWQSVDFLFEVVVGAV